MHSTVFMKIRKYLVHSYNILLILDTPGWICIAARVKSTQSALFGVKSKPICGWKKRVEIKRLASLKFVAFWFLYSQIDFKALKKVHDT